MQKCDFNKVALPLLKMSVVYRGHMQVYERIKIKIPKFPVAQQIFDASCFLLLTTNVSILYLIVISRDDKP